MKFTIILAFLFAASVQGTPMTSRYQGDSVPYIVSITDAMQYTQHTASGSILNHQYILTNARPFYGLWHEPWHFTVFANIAQTWAGSADNYRVESYVIHPDFDADTGENDIAILRTDTPIIFHARVQPIPLNTFQLLADQEVLLSGFGLVEQDLITHVPLARVDFRTISNAECAGLLGSDNDKLFDSKACILPKDGRIICNYDNGAPLTIDNQLVGISSWSNRCLRNYPIIVERISAHTDFIAQNS